MFDHYQEHLKPEHEYLEVHGFVDMEDAARFTADLFRAHREHAEDGVACPALPFAPDL